MAGVFITFEGLDGSGKTSHLRAAAAELERCGHSVCQTKEPGGTGVGEAIRRIFLDPPGGELDGVTELLLLFASRRSHLVEVIEPALERDQIVLCDRFTDSTLAYQGAGRGLSERWILQVDEVATGSRRPDLTLLFDLPPEVARARSRSPRRQSRPLGSGGVDRLDEEDLHFYSLVRARYLELARREPARFRVIDSSGERVETARQVRAALAHLLRPGAVSEERTRG